MKIKLFITDIDGVWTDGGMYYTENGDEFKKFNTSDSAGVLFLSNNDIKIAIITGEDTEIVRNRAKKLKIEDVYLGVKNKVKIAKKIMDKYNVNWDEIAYIGDDINDLNLLKKVGLSACPQQAKSYIKKEVNYICKLEGGMGAFREFVEYYLETNDLLDKTVKDILLKFNTNE